MNEHLHIRIPKAEFYAAMFEHNRKELRAMITPMYKVYTASKIDFAQVWRDQLSHRREVFLNSRWLKHNELATPDTPEFAKRFWIEDEEDVSQSDALFIAALPGTHLRGALVEAGMAIAYGVAVICIGEHEDFGTWRYHPGVFNAIDMAEAISLLPSARLYTEKNFFGRRR